MNAPRPLKIVLNKEIIMELLGFPNCCTAGVMIGMGRSSTAGHTGVPYGQDYTKDTFCEAARECLRQAGRQNYGIVFAITNSDQKLAEECLPLLGFVCGHKEVGKNNHADKTITSWSYQVTKEDRQPKAVPANPFVKAKPQAPVAQLVGAEVQAGMQALQQARPRIIRFTMENGAIQEGFLDSDRDQIAEWFTMSNNFRPTINDRLWRENRRDEMGRYRALPTRGRLYSFEELRHLFIPAGARYRRMTRWAGRDRYSNIACASVVPQLGMPNTEVNRNSAGFVFA